MTSTFGQSRRRRGTVLGILLIAILAVPVAIGFRRMDRATVALHAAESSLAEAAQGAEELVELRSRQERISLQQRPASDVIALVNAVLADVGLPSRHLRSLAPESEGGLEPSGGARGQQIKRQSLRLMLESVGVQEFGAFLARWQQSQSIWTVTRIEITHVRAGGGDSAENDRYDVSLLISALYIEE